MTHTRPGSLSFAATCLLALWLGAALFFAAAVAPAAFDVLPTGALAGALVGRLLRPLFVIGAIAGLAVFAIELRARVARSRLRVGAAAVLFAMCAIGQFVIGARIERLRTGNAQPITALAPADPRRVAFGRWHALSVAALGAGMLAAAAAVASGRCAAVGTDRGA